MTVHIGIDSSTLPWKVCVVEHDTIRECTEFEDLSDLYLYLERLYNRYSAVNLALAIQSEIALTPLEVWYEDQQAQASFAVTAQTLHDFLIVLDELAPTGYLLPAIRYLPTIPTHRRLLRESLGSSQMLCISMTLLYHMRQQGAVWSELTFGCLELSDTFYRLIVIREGKIIDGTALWQPFRAADMLDASEDLLEQAILEQLSREFASLMAIHHCEDVVLLDHTHGIRKEGIIEYFADLYQIFFFPSTRTELAGFEVAQGAALLAAGLNQSGLASEIVLHLLSSTEP